MTDTLHLAAKRRPDAGTPRIPHTAHLREFTLPDGRKLLADRRSVAFLVEGKAEEFAGKTVTIIGWKTMAKAVPVLSAYADLKIWWRDDANGGSA
jgi:hypothetical protein